MNRLSRSNALKIAAIISVLISIQGLWLFLPLLAQGQAAIESPPYGVVLSGMLIHALSFVAAYGLWYSRRWGVILTILLCAVGIPQAVPGIFFAPTLLLWASALGGTLLSVVVIVLCLWRDPRGNRVL